MSKDVYTKEYIEHTLDEVKVMLEEEAKLLKSGTYKTWEMSSGVILDCLSMACDKLNKADTQFDQAWAFLIIDTILSEYRENTYPDPDETVH